MLDIMKAKNMLSPLLSAKATGENFNILNNISNVIKFFSSFAAIMSGDSTVHDPLRDTVKNLRLAIEFGDKLDQPMPLTATASEMYMRARRAYPQDDTSSVFIQLMH